LGRDLPELNAAASPYVAVRVTDLRDVDVANLRFDFDLTFAVLLMHADGTVYHRYGGRGAANAEQYLGTATLVRLLRDTLPEHQEYDRVRSSPSTVEPLRAIDLPVLQRKVAAGQRIDCVHCHTVHDAEARDAMLRGRWRRDDAYVFPDPARIGIALDAERQSIVRVVRDESAAAKAGIRPGDELLALGEQPSVRTFADVQWALHRAPFAAAELAVRFRREDAVHTATLVLEDGWKRCPPEDFAWRPMKWNLSPSPGFGGALLSLEARQKIGLGEAPFAMRVIYLVDWGEQKARGQAARAAGLKKGDVVIGFAGKRDYVSFDHLHAHCALMLTAGVETEIAVWRDGREITLRYALPE
jgi:serine protease Do